MAKVPTLRAGELVTANYGWTKPTVGASNDAWGDYINTNLDGMDAIVHGVSVVANAAYPASNPSGYQTAAQVASVVMNDNRIINGDMRTDQRNNGGLATANGYTIDRWAVTSSVASKVTCQRLTAGANLIPLGFGNCVALVSTSAYTAAAGDQFGFYQPIEADMVSDFAWGTANAQPVTLSFWVNSNNLTGTFSGAIQNQPAPANRSYPFTFNIPAVNTWTKVAVTIPGDTAGAWVMSGNAAGVRLAFDLGSGINFRAPANAWASGVYWGATGAGGIVATNGASLLLTGVKLEIGSVATPFNRKSPQESLADCQRYYQVGNFKLDMYSAAGVAVGSYQSYPVAMVAVPTVTPTFGTQTNGSGGGAVVQGVRGVEIFSVATAAGTVALLGSFTASAEL